ncbi:hypothetical protein [Streptomyces silvisoli]|uniref:Uncharacterized protein n=1 Tax=Streptomyces silvisoli TaxID=3034235 RepID=A0ABT5ZU92_9ACTN|nr:hypothetical protein [Streptomyces silvisoli]MDF3293392.1 hypothetical protein [Streptomyces silvisoli]
MTDPRRVIAKRAENLEPAKPYVRGWADAKRGTEALAEQLRAAGLGSDFLGLKADVSVFGDGLVCLGPVRPAAVELFAKMLATGLATEMAEHAGLSSAVEPPDAPAA